MEDSGFIHGEEAIRAVCELVAKDANAKYLAFDAEYEDEFATLYLKGWAGISPWTSRSITAYESCSRRWTSSSTARSPSCAT